MSYKITRDLGQNISTVQGEPFFNIMLTSVSLKVVYVFTLTWFGNIYRFSRWRSLVTAVKVYFLRSGAAFILTLLSNTLQLTNIYTTGRV